MQRESTEPEDEIFLPPTDKNREFAGLAGCWHEILDCNHPAREWYKTCLCGEHFNSNKEAEEHIINNSPDYVADPRLVLREMMKREDWDSFCDYIGYLDFSEDGYPLRYVRMDYILDITGKLRDAAIEFLKEATDENKFYKTT